MKRLVLGLLLILPALHADRVGTTVTIAAGTPVRVSATAIYADRIFIQMKVAASGGVGYVMLGVPPGVTPSTASWPTIQLCAATSTVPGCAYSDVGANIDISRIWIDGAHTGDTVTVSYERK